MDHLFRNGQAELTQLAPRLPQQLLPGSGGLFQKSLQLLGLLLPLLLQLRLALDPGLPQPFCIALPVALRLGLLAHLLGLLLRLHLPPDQVVLRLPPGILQDLLRLNLCKVDRAGGVLFLCLWS